MYIIVRCQDNCAEEVLNIIYGSCENLAIDWINQYLITEMTSLTFCPPLQNTKNVSYKIEECDSNCSKLVRQFKKIHQGYIYNSSEKLIETICTVKFLEYTGSTPVIDTSVNPLWTNINSEINNRVIKHLDTDTLRRLFRDIQVKVNTKRIWTNVEYISLVGSTLKEFRKELFKSIAKKTKRFGKQQEFMIRKKKE
jgi:hypothetical protein